MTWVYQASALMLLLLGVLSMVIMLRAAGGLDALLTVLLFGTAGVAMTLLLGRAADLPRARDVALVMALLAGILGVACVLRGWPPGANGDDAES